MQEVFEFRGYMCKSSFSLISAAWTSKVGYGNYISCLISEQEGRRRKASPIRDIQACKIIRIRGVEGSTMVAPVEVDMCQSESSVTYVCGSFNERLEQ